MQLRLVEFPVPVSFDSNHATIDVDSNSASFDLNDEVAIDQDYVATIILLVYC